MAKASSQWEQQVKQIWNSPHSHEGVRKPGLKMPMRRSSWLLGMAVAIAVPIWNWKLFVATSAGVLVMLAVYALQGWDWQSWRSNLRQFLNGANRQIAIAVGTGGLASFATYMAVSIWLASDDRWLATGAILQGTVTIATLVLVGWQFLNSKPSSDETGIDLLLMHLTDTDPLKRLIAVRQIVARIKTAPVTEKRAIADCFCLMLPRETEAIVRDAILDGLQATEPAHQLGIGVEPLPVPPLKKRTPAKVRTRIYEYEE